METCRTKILGFSLLLGGLVLCGIGLWLLLSPAQYRAEVKIIIMSDVSDIEVYQKNHPGAAWYDPYFIQISFEIIRSPAVLSNVVEGLNLNDRWGKKYSWSGKLETKQTFKLLRKRMNVQAVSNTEYLKISVTSEDADEAAQLANAIAQSYQNYHLNVRKQLTAKGIEVLQEQYQMDEEKIRVLQTNVDLLRDKYHINKQDEADFNNPYTLSNLPKPLTPTEREERQKEYERTKPFWDEKRKLNNLLEFHRLVAAKIEFEKKSLVSQSSSVQIVDPAVPPQTPIGSDRVLGALLLAIGLFPIVSGFLLLKSSRRQFT